MVVVNIKEKKEKDAPRITEHTKAEDPTEGDRRRDSSNENVVSDITEGIDVPAKFKEAAGRTKGDGLLASLVKAAELVSVAHGNIAEEGPSALRKSFGKRGNSSLIVIHNRTAARLTLDRKSDRRGHIHERSAYPQILDPGSNGAFLHVSEQPDRKDGSKGLVAYTIDVYDVKKGSWIASACAVAFSWDTGAYGGYGGVKFESARERIICHTGTAYDGQKISGEAIVNDKQSPSPVYMITFSQKKVEEKDMPLTVKIVKIFKKSPNAAE